MTESRSSDKESRLRKLAGIAHELRTGSGFSVTRLSIVKGFCEDPQAASRFVLHLARLTWAKMQKEGSPSHRASGRRLPYKTLVGRAVSQMESFLEKQTPEKWASLEKLLSRVQGVQNKYKRMKWGSARIIESTELLLVENGLRCVLFPRESAYWAYQVAKRYAERYDPRYFDGLIPKSAPMVEDIADFWCRYLFGKSLDQWLAIRKGGRK